MFYWGIIPVNMTTKILIFILARWVAECCKRSEFIISSRAKRACSTWTARGLSRLQNSMRHKSPYEYILGVRQWLHVALRHRAFCVSRQHRLCSWWLAHFHVLFMKGSCVVYSSMKQCLQSVNHEQFPIHMTQNSKHNKWLEIFNFQPKLPWRMPTKIHRERGRRRQQEAAHKAQRASLSTAKATNVVNTATANMYRGSDKILQLHCQWSRWREGTPTADASKSDAEIRQRLQFTIKLSF